ncbi:MAG: hypothetical protein AAFR62_20275, partial [Cyanobacteria bacterium J06629_2]
DRPKDGTGRIRVCASQTTEPAVTVGQIAQINFSVTLLRIDSKNQNYPDVHSVQSFIGCKEA